MQKDISTLEEQEFNARKTNALEAPEYLRDFDSFRENWGIWIDASEDELINKIKIISELIDKIKIISELEE
jgi:hypothetical protein